MKRLPLWIFAYALAAIAVAIVWQLASEATKVVTKATTVAERIR